MTLGFSCYKKKLGSPLIRQAILGISLMASSSRAFSELLHQPFPYNPPSWTHKTLNHPPANGRLHLANLPTPVYKLRPNTVKSPKAGDDVSLLKKLAELDISLYIKRDDMTGGVETGGNKIRKLEFLLADALAKECRSVVTIGGEQSNHCRATAAASRMLGLEPHLILRTRRAESVQAEKEDFGYVGNILFDRIVGSSVYTCTPREYGKVGSKGLVSRLCAHLKDQSPYPIPVGGSNGLGTWGYINAVDELLAQWELLESKPTLDHVVFACGSGGTASGLSLGLALAHGALEDRHTPKRLAPTAHAIAVCDSPEYFYDYVAGLADEMGLNLPPDTSTISFVRQHMTVHQGKGLGYAECTPEELDFVTAFALETGVVLDPVYSGKALYHFMTHVVDATPEQYRGSNILFWHTGTLSIWQSWESKTFMSASCLTSRFQRSISFFTCTT
jgi:D-cysteine desulfhydrase